MPDTTLILNGNSVLDRVAVNTRSNGGHQNEGFARVMRGELPFDEEAIVTIQVENANAALEVTGASRIVGVTVYENAAAYVAGTPLYDYTPMNPGQSANIQSDVSGLGDTYLRFNANVLRSDDDDAPPLQQLFVAAGVDLSPVARGEEVRIDRFTDNDYNASGSIDTGTVEVANGAFATENNIYAVICFAADTRIATPGGPRPVQELRPGDLVTTLDEGPQPVRWAGHRVVAGTGDNAPIRIAAGTLGARRDLYVSPNHRLLVEGRLAELLFGESQVLVAAKHLVNDSTIRQVPRAVVSYHHILLERHQVVLADGCPAETLFPGAEACRAVDPAARAEIAALVENTGPGLLARHELSRYEALLLSA